MKTFRSILNEEEIRLHPVTGTQYGSNPGGVHVDDSGNKHYVKFYRDPDQGRAEVLAGRIYDHMGIKTLSPRHAIVNGRPAVVTRWNHDLVPIMHDQFAHLEPHQREDLGRIYHGAVLTKNWDAIGLGYDNVLAHRRTGSIHSIDHGGSFHFRAQGGPKEYGPDAEELHSLRHNDGSSGHVFGHVLGQDGVAHAAGHKVVAGIDMDHVRDAFRDSGLPNHEEMFRNFSARRDKILTHQP